MTFDIKFDYRFDDLGFFTPDKRAVLEAAAQTWSTYIEDEFADVTIKEDIQVPIVSIPEESEDELDIETPNSIVALEEPIDDLLIFAYSLNLPEESAVLGNGGPFGVYQEESDLENRYNGADFQPWLGTIYFNHNAEFYVDPAPPTSEVPIDRNDLFTIALHEIGHVLGIGTAPIFTRLTDEINEEFKGDRSMALNNNEAIPLHGDLSHIDENGIQDVNALLEPSLIQGDRTLISELDLALLEDIGYETKPINSNLSLEEFLDNTSLYMEKIRDFDGNNLGASDSWEKIGSADIQGDGDREYVFVNSKIGRWATVGADITGNVDFSNHGEGGDTRVVGIYIDPLIPLGIVEKGGPFDSQQRFQNDLLIDNLTLIENSDRDYDDDGLQEVYFKVNDGTAVLHAYMHADGNIQYANYQSQSDLQIFMADNGIDSSVWSDWF